MRYMIKILFCICAIASALTLAAETAVWRISSDTSSIYVGGTIHLLRASDFPLPEEFEQAFEDASTVYFETDMGEIQGQAFQGMLLSKCLLEEDSLDVVLSPEALAALDEYCSKLGLPLEQLSRFKPALIVTTLAVLELQKLGISQEGVDLYYFNKAVEAGKSLGQLESAEDQAAYVCAMGEGNESEFVIHSLRDLAETGDIMPELIAAWRSGDLAAIEESLVSELKNDYPDLYQSLLVDRNHRWMPTIEACFESEETELFLVGSGHLAGEDGVLSLLEQRGYRVEQLGLE